jgi:predicted nucleic acid-binding protein
MRLLLLDTSVVSLLFKPDHALHAKCVVLVSESQLFISFMSRAELLLWPKWNHWGAKRAEELLKHIDLCTTLFPDEETCTLWVDIMDESRSVGRPIATADA